MELNYEYVNRKPPVKRVSFQSEGSVRSDPCTPLISEAQITVERDITPCIDDVVFDLRRGHHQEVYLNRSSIIALHKIFGDIIDSEGWKRLE